MTQKHPAPNSEQDRVARAGIVKALVASQIHSKLRTGRAAFEVEHPADINASMSFTEIFDAVKSCKLEVVA